ncbi:unnamed protein product [Ectocarpus sp. CCAP 1310/34]|nr:unnamed protein product [Ectocarpus sp. CCAP 1310/34]
MTSSSRNAPAPMLGPVPSAAARTLAARGTSPTPLQAGTAAGKPVAAA